MGEPRKPVCSDDPPCLEGLMAWLLRGDGVKCLGCGFLVSMPEQEGER